MRFYDLKERKPKNSQWCIIKEPISTGTIHVFTHPQQYFDDEGFVCHSRAAYWAPFPKHVGWDPTGWKSEYRGDELPKHNCECLICFDFKPSGYNTPYFAYFLAKENRFCVGPQDIVIAFMEI